MTELEGFPIPMQQQLRGLFQQAMQLLKTEMDVLNEKGKPKFIDVCDWLSSKMVTTEERTAQAPVHAALVAGRGQGGLSRERRAALCVASELQCFLSRTGCETSKFPLEVLFEWPNQWQQSPVVRPGDVVEDFSLAVSIGSSVTMACHLLCWVAAKLDWLGSEDFLPYDLRKGSGAQIDAVHLLLSCYEHNTVK